MKSEYLSAEWVIDDLGDKVAQGLAMMVARTRADLALYRQTFPGWVANSTDRGLLNWCHDRAWAHAVVIFDGVREVSFVDRPPTREVYVGTRYRLRVKKHDIDGAIAEFEHALMSERTRDGLEAARARGRTGGQKPKLGVRQARLAREMYEAGELTVAQIAAEFGVTRPTIYRHLDRLDDLDAAGH